MMEYGPFPSAPKNDRRATKLEVALFVALTIVTISVFALVFVI